MEVTLNVRRYNPESDQPEAYTQEYRLELEATSTVLDGLIKVREEVDGTLALRCSCRSAICGSCAMRIDGRARLACNTMVADVIDDGGNVAVEPAGNMPVVKDLVVEFDTFWDKVRAVRPWLQPQGPEPEPNEEYIASSESMGDLADVMACIMCGACVSDCTVLAVDSTFLGPAALAKAYRFVADPRDDTDAERLGELNESGGIWDCTRCMQCVEVCPKGVDPMGRIMALRDRAMEAGYTKTYGARHATAFTDSVGHSGWLDELRLPIKTFGIFNVKEMLKLLPVGIRTQLNGKRPPIFHRSIPGVQNIRRLFEKVEGKR
jgi:succinate dehydrogenase / fumarate reductase iron-sulfur subunit